MACRPRLTRKEEEVQGYVGEPEYANEDPRGHKEHVEYGMLQVAAEHNKKGIHLDDGEPRHVAQVRSVRERMQQEREGHSMMSE